MQKQVAFLTLLAVMLGFTIGVVGQAKPLTENQKIELLLKGIDTLEGAKFVRNGSTYTASQASSHLRMKWGKAGSAVKTAQDFIDKIASKSSMTGEPYKIIMKDGKEVVCRDYLNQRLLQINKGITTQVK
jgi:hypothetical protein